MTNPIGNRKIDSKKYREHRVTVTTLFNKAWDDLQEHPQFTSDHRLCASVKIYRYLTKTGEYQRGMDIDNSLKALWDCLFDDLNRVLYPAIWTQNEVYYSRAKKARDHLPKPPRLPLDDEQIDRLVDVSRFWMPFVVEKQRDPVFKRGRIEVVLWAI